MLSGNCRVTRLSAVLAWAHASAPNEPQFRGVGRVDVSKPGASLALSPASLPWLSQWSLTANECIGKCKYKRIPTSCRQGRYLPLLFTSQPQPTRRDGFDSRRDSRTADPGCDGEPSAKI